MINEYIYENFVNDISRNFKYFLFKYNTSRLNKIFVDAFFRKIFILIQFTST